jgi:hypothetical protein
MALAPGATTTPEDSSPDLGPYRSAGVFISYASEDHDIAQAVFQALQAVSGTVFDRIWTFLDSKSIDPGNEISDEIKAGLNKSDFLVVLYTGRFKHSHGYTGWEVGFFQRLIDEERASSGRTTRKIIYLYSGEMPSIGKDILGISIDVDPEDLAGSRDGYVKKSAQTPDNPDVLAGVLLEFANRAESRLPPPFRDDRNTLDRKREERRTLVAQNIIPALKGKLFDSMGMRVTQHSVEQRLIEFELPKPSSDQIYTTIPDDAKLTPHTGALEIFGISQQNDTLKWNEFRDKVRARDPLGGSSILIAIEQALISAVSPALRTDNDQILKSSDDQIFRVLVTRQLDYYNGQKVIHVYFIKKLQGSSLGNNATSTILGFINVSAKYRFIFIERDSSLSVESFLLEHEPAKIQYKIRQLIRELLLLEEEARNLKLDQVAAISQYFGGDKEHLAAAKSLQDRWYEARGRLMASAEKMLGLPPTAADYSVASKEWLSTLQSFRETSEEINSTVTVQALENLKKSFALSE